MSVFAPTDYGPVLGPLLDGDRRRPLGAGVRAEPMRKQLARVTAANAFAHTQLADADMASCCLSGLWLVHNFLDEAHAICQDIDTPSGSYWHALMHRREGDFTNSKYWFHRVGWHEALGLLGQRVGELAAVRGESRLIANLITGGEMDPNAFVDLVESAVHGTRPDALELCLDIQQAEWELLFDWCYRRAVGE